MHPNTKCRKHAVAGCTAGLSTVFALQPLDVIKTRLQVQDGAGTLPLYRGTVDALRNIAKDEGWRALYAGLSFSGSDGGHLPVTSPTPLLPHSHKCNNNKIQA